MIAGHKGFTIIELVVVITVIAILATIAVASYNGTQIRADTTSRLNEMKAWEHLYRTYATKFGTYPRYTGSPDGNGGGGPDLGWCLGAGFPVTGSNNTPPRGSGNCRDLDGTTYKYYVNTQLNDELAKAGKLPDGPRTPPDGRALGPYAKYYTAGNVEIINIFKGSTCPSGTTTGYYYSSFNTVTCTINLAPLE